MRGRRAGGDEGNVAQLLGNVVPVEESERPASQPGGYLRLQPRLVDGDAARSEQVDAPPVDVDSEHVVAGRRKSCGGDRAHVSKPDDGYLQSSLRSPSHTPWMPACAGMTVGLDYCHPA